MEAVTEGTGMAFSEVLTTLRSVSENVASLATSVSTLGGEMKTLRWTMPLIVTIGLAVIGIIVAIR